MKSSKIDQKTEIFGMLYRSKIDKVQTTNRSVAPFVVLRCLCSVVIAICLSEIAYGQQRPDDDPQNLAGRDSLPSAPFRMVDNLQDAWIAAYQTNPDLLAARAAVAASDEEIPLALAARRPSISLSAQTGRTHRRFGGISEQRSPSEISLQITQPLLTSGRADSARGRGEAIIIRQRSLLDAVEQEILFAALVAYMEVITTNELVKFNEQNVVLLREQSEANESRFSLGDNTITDVTQSKARLAGAKGILAAAIAEQQIARQNFAQITHTQAGALQWPENIPPLPANLDEAYALALQANPTLIAAQKAIDVSDFDHDGARAELLPQVDLIGSLSYQRDSAQFANSARDASAILRATVPLYQSGAAYSRARQSLQIGRQRQIELETTRRQLLRDLTAAWQNLRAARQREISSHEQVRANEIALQGVEREAELGARTSLDILDATQELLAAQVTEIEAKRDIYIASYQLIALTGAMNARQLALDTPVYNPQENTRKIQKILIDPQFLAPR